MVQSRNHPGQPTFFSYGLKFSILFHVVLVLWLVAHWAATSMMPVTKEELKKMQPKQSIRVDVVDLPSLKFNELNKVDLTKEAATIPLPEEKKEAVALPPIKPSATAMQLPSDKKIKVVKEKEENKDSKTRLQEIQKNLREEAKRQEILSKYKHAVKGDDDKRPVLGGNIISKGGSVKGEVANEIDEFTAVIQTHVRKFWKAPPWSVGQNLSTHVNVKLSPTGRVLSKKITKSSGRPEYDASAIEAVEAADPFPAPPELYKRIVLQEGITCGFP